MTKKKRSYRHKAARWASQQARTEDAIARGAAKGVEYATAEGQPWAEADSYHAARSQLQARDAWGIAAVLTLVWLLTPTPCKVCGGRCKGSGAI